MKKLWVYIHYVLFLSTLVLCQDSTEQDRQDRVREPDAVWGRAVREQLCHACLALGGEMGGVWEEEDAGKVVLGSLALPHR